MIKTVVRVGRPQAQARAHLRGTVASSAVSSSRVSSIAALIRNEAPVRGRSGRSAAAMTMAAGVPTLDAVAERTAGEKMFEAYLRERGIAVPEHEPDLGAKKWPDYLVEHAGERCICEVKEFARGTTSMPHQPGKRGGSWSMQTVLRPIRSQIREAARQLKPFADSGLPLVVVLTNPHAAAVNCGSQEMIWAMCGDPVIRLQVGAVTGSAADSPIFTVDRNGRLRSDHPYISAVAIVRTQWILEPYKDLSVEVFDSPRGTAAALPGCIFDGKDDRRLEYRVDLGRYVDAATS
ncbi:MAG: hypothetical protein QOG59_402 [Solirubrobacteraceae bacterium]|nr:hypothetical protein [Solirubrobacteraceae bacterium]